MVRQLTKTRFAEIMTNQVFVRGVFSRDSCLILIYASIDNVIFSGRYSSNPKYYDVPSMFNSLEFDNQQCDSVADCKARLNKMIDSWKSDPRKDYLYSISDPIHYYHMKGIETIKELSDFNPYVMAHCSYLLMMLSQKANESEGYATLFRRFAAYRKQRLKIAYEALKKIAT